MQGTAGPEGVGCLGCEDGDGEEGFGVGQDVPG